MAFKSAKKKLGREEIIDILKRNAELYKNEPDFIHYLVDLAVFLIEYQYDREEAAQAKDKTNRVLTTYSPLEMYKIYRETDSSSTQYCKLCGTRLGPDKRCVGCGNIL